MKKVLSFIMATVFLLCCAGTFAEDAANITFRGIPWGSSMAEVLELLKADLGDFTWEKQDNVEPKAYK